MKRRKRDLDGGVTIYRTIRHTDVSNKKEAVGIAERHATSLGYAQLEVLSAEKTPNGHWFVAIRAFK